MSAYRGLTYQRAQAYTVEHRDGRLVVLVELEHSDDYGNGVRINAAIPADVAREFGVEVLDAAEAADPQ